uniref:Uncharacterized protein n=1 Tax=Arundo donax TaxID=35708 RepID=A0A0A9AVP1_ARUDO
MAPFFFLKGCTVGETLL